MRLHDCAVDEEELRSLLGPERTMQSVPTPGERPTTIAPVDPIPTSEAIRQVTPWRARAENPSDRLDERAGIALWAAQPQLGNLGREQRPMLLDEDVAIPPHLRANVDLN